MSDDLLFGSLNLPMIDKEKALSEIRPLIGTEHMFWEPYRGMNMIPLMSKGSAQGYDSIISNKYNDEFVWSSFAPNTLIDYFEEVVFPWMNMRTRVMILLTPPNTANNEHLDSRLHEVGTRKHKFRIVLQGTTDSLYFITRNGNVFAPSIDQPFLMDGSWPHGMDNTCDGYKVTLALGSPWEGLDDYGDKLSVLLNRNDYMLPDDIEQYLGDENRP
jgi:hypothetical protein